MPKFALHYIVNNKGSGEAGVRFYSDAESAQVAADIEEYNGEAFGDNPHKKILSFDDNGNLLNPRGTAEELKPLLAEFRGEEVDDDGTPATAFNKAAKRADGTLETTVWYVTINGGDGGANAGFYADKKSAAMAAELETEYDYFEENGPHEKKLSFDAEGKLLQPFATFEKLKAEWKELTGEETEVAAPAAAPRGRDYKEGLAGKTIVFTGTLESMKRSVASYWATAYGATVADKVTEKTDFVVAGADAGSKLDKARALGVKVLDEKEWLGMLPAVTKRPAAPKP